MNIAKDNQVLLLRDIHRVTGKERRVELYGKAGEIGQVLECFRPRDVWYAKVLVGEEVKTFRLTSLRKF